MMTVLVSDGMVIVWSVVMVIAMMRASVITFFDEKLDRFC